MGSRITVILSLHDRWWKKMVSREKLLDLVWGYEFDGGTRTVDVHIQRLRHKLHLENQIRTVYKLGYRLEVHE